MIGWIDLHGLLDRQRAMVRQQPGNYVLNGIAYHVASNRLMVTGKMWDKMYQIRVRTAKGLGPQHVLDRCSLGDDRDDHRSAASKARG